MFEHATAFLLQRHWKSHIHWLLYLYSFNIRTLFLLWFICDMNLLHTRNARCWFQLWFVVLFQIMFFIYSLCQGWKQTHEPTSQTSTVRKHLRWNSLNASRVQNDPSWRKLHAFTLTLVLMTSVSTLSRYRLFLADLDSPPRAANRADPPVSHKHPKHKR